MTSISKTNMNENLPELGSRLFNIYNGSRVKEDKFEKFSAPYVFFIHRAIGKEVHLREGTACEIKTSKIGYRILFGLAAVVLLPFTLIGLILTALSGSQKKAHDAALLSLLFQPEPVKEKPVLSNVLPNRIVLPSTSSKNMVNGVADGNKEGQNNVLNPIETEPLLPMQIPDELEKIVNEIAGIIYEGNEHLDKLSIEKDETLVLNEDKIKQIESHLKQQIEKIKNEILQRFDNHLKTKETLIDKHQSAVFLQACEKRRADFVNDCIKRDQIISQERDNFIKIIQEAPSDNLREPDKTDETKKKDEKNSDVTEQNQPPLKIFTAFFTGKIRNNQKQKIDTIIDHLKKSAEQKVSLFPFLKFNQRDPLGLAIQCDRTGNFVIINHVFDYLKKWPSTNLYQPKLYAEEYVNLATNQSGVNNKKLIALIKKHFNIPA